MHRDPKQNARVITASQQREIDQMHGCRELVLAVVYTAATAGAGAAALDCTADARARSTSSTPAAKHTRVAGPGS